MDTKNDNVEELQNELMNATTKTIKPKKDKKETDLTKKKTTVKKAERSTTKKKNDVKTNETASKKKTSNEKPKENGSDSKSASKKSNEKTVKNTKTATRKTKVSKTLSEDTKKTEKGSSKKVAKDTTKKTTTAKKAKVIKETKEKVVTEEKQVNTSEDRDESIEIIASESNDMNTTSSSSNKENIKQFKLFFVSDMDEEATYLHEMSLKGLHFESKKGMQYFFKQGEATNYFYHLGYHEKDKHDGTRYLDNYADAGWDNIYHEKAEFDGVWNYFRIEMPHGVSEPNIFSDRSSRLSLYKRLLSAWRSLLALDIICFLCMLFVYIFLTNHPGKLTGTVMSICVILILLIIIIFVIYLRAYLKISKKQNELQNI